MDFAQELDRIKAVYAEKRADVLERLHSFFEANPEARTALVGAGVGGAAGLAKAFTTPKSQRRTVNDVVTGAGLGAAVGGAGHFLHDAYAASREAPRPVNVGGSTFNIPRSALRDKKFVEELAHAHEPSMVGRAADAISSGIGWLGGNPLVAGGAAAGGLAHAGLSTMNFPFAGKGLGDTWLNFGRTSRVPQASSYVWEGLKNLKSEGKDLIGPTAERDLAAWRQLVESDPAGARTHYGMRGKGEFSAADLVRALKREAVKPIAKPMPVTHHTLNSLAEVGGRVAGAVRDEKGVLKLPPTAPPAFNLFGARRYTPGLGGKLMGGGLVGGGLVGGLLAQDYLDTARREQDVKNLLARKLVIGENS